MKDIFIVSAKRTPLGSWGGALKKFSATELGSMAIKGALEAAGVDPKKVHEVFMGNVVSANLGQAPAKQMSLGAGIPNRVSAGTSLPQPPSRSFRFVPKGLLRSNRETSNLHVSNVRK